jgi:putative endonuclease
MEKGQRPLFFYTDITNHLENRLRAHENGTAAKYTRGRAPFILVYREKCGNRSAASKRKAETKRLNHKEKLALSKL